MYTCIVVELGSRSSHMGEVEKDDRTTQIRNQVAKMLVINGIIFFCLHLPVRCCILVLCFSKYLCELFKTVHCIMNLRYVRCDLISRYSADHWPYLHSQFCNNNKKKCEICMYGFSLVCLLVLIRIPASFEQSIRKDMVNKP